MQYKKIIAGRYLVDDLLGTGGYSIVYKAVDMKSNQQVAIKKYKNYDANNRKRVRDDIERELNVLRYTSHPGLPHIYNILYEDNEFYLVMEFISGRTIAQIISSGHRMTKKEVFSISEQILSALYYLHSLEPPIIYRDMKPDNVIINDDGIVKLIDFGCAKRFNRDISTDLLAIGTPGFAAPEQYGDNNGRGLYNTNIKTDIYGVGALMYYMASGNVYNPYKKTTKRHKNADNNISAKIKERIYKIRYGRQFRKMIEKATRIRPEQRFDSVMEMLKLI